MELKLKKKLVYVAGPMTGYPEFNFPAFNAAAHKLRSQGFEVINPAELDAEDLNSDGTAAHAWEYYLRRDLRVLLDCDAIFLLPGWAASKGASLELHIAKHLGMEVMSGNE